MGRYAVFLVVLILLIGGLELARGGLYVDRHEGDTAHMVEIILRMLDGQVPHLDFSTPIGAFAFLPVLAMSKLGFGIGEGFMAGQILVALCFAVPVWRVGTSRLDGLAAWGFGLVSMAMILSLIYGGESLGLSVSMYYNRWAWAASFSAILLAILPPQSERAAPRLDGILAGLLLAFLAFCKPTFFVGFVLPVALGFASRSAWRSLVFGVITGVLVALAMVAAYGLDFLPAYVGDLLSVTRSETRAAPGLPLIQVVNAPQFLVGSLVLVLSVIVLRQAGGARIGLLLFLLAPGFVYVTFQNYGNDPKWLFLLCIFLLSQRPERGVRVLFNADARNAIVGLSLVAFALSAPSLQNMVTSPFRHLALDDETYVPQFANRPEVADIFVDSERTGMVLGRTALVDRYAGLTPYVREAERFEPVTFLGETLPRCTLQAGDLALHHYMADRLKEAPFNFPPESQFFMADIASAVWILGGFEPLQGGAPWYYSGAPGIEHADAIIVPTCPLDAEIERNALAAVEKAGLLLREPLRDPMMLVYPIIRE